MEFYKFLVYFLVTIEISLTIFLVLVILYLFGLLDKRE
jgi:hypothetical protein